jgi:hypothetical protein
MIEPLPNCFSICESAAARAFALFSSILGASEVLLEMTLSILIIPSIDYGVPQRIGALFFLTISRLTRQWLTE